VRAPRGVRERNTVIAGVGKSQTGRRLQRAPIELVLEACLAAVSDAGLALGDIDGLVHVPGGPGIAELQDVLSFDLAWHGSIAGGPAQLSAVMQASMAVSSGLCRHVLVYHHVATRGAGPPGPPRAAGGDQWLLPFRAATPMHWNALRGARFLHEANVSREQLGAIVLNARRNAAANPAAVYTEPLTMEDYLAARVISTPITLLDCDVPVDGCTAFVVSHADYAPDAPQPAVQLHAFGAALSTRLRWTEWDDVTDVMDEVAAQLWSRSVVGPDDVDVAALYDGFSFHTAMWIQALGFCERGEVGAFLEGGERIARTGSLPLHTDGGQLSGGRLHGFGHLAEACWQLRGDLGERQVEGAEVAVVTNGASPIAGAMVLTRRR